MEMENKMEFYCKSLKLVYVNYFNWFAVPELTIRSNFNHDNE